MKKVLTSIVIATAAAFLPQLSVSASPASWDDNPVSRIAGAAYHIDFKDNRTTLTFNDYMAIDSYADNILSKDDTHIFYLTAIYSNWGRNNKKTGLKRANNVRKYLVRRYAIPKGQVVIKQPIAIKNRNEETLSGTVIFENE